ncbi:MAG TPA: cytochrome C oxidase subunit IV family protein [Anaeromyxobacteraceae bacterium]
MAITTRDSRFEHGEPASGARYWIVWVLLLAGTLLTFGLSRVHLHPPFNLIVALAIASAKSVLVVLFFMHLWDHGGANRIVFATSVVFVVLLIGIVVLDNATRFELTNPGRGATLQMEPPGPDIFSPRGPPEPASRVDMPPAGEPGHDVGIPSPAPGR